MTWLQEQDAAKTIFGFSEFALFGECVRQTVERIDVGGVERDGVAIAGDGGRQVIVQTIGIGKIVVKVGARRMSLNGGAYELNREVVVTRLLRDDSEQVEGVCMLRLEFEDFAIANFGLGQAARLMMLQAEGQRCGNFLGSARGRL